MTAPVKKLIDAAMGREECDGVIRDVEYLDVFSCQWRKGDLFFKEGYWVGVEPGLKAKREWNTKGTRIVPGFIDAHVHVESSLMIPRSFEEAVLPKGTTTAICDPHELANVVGTNGIRFFLNEAEKRAIDLKIMLSSCVPATHMETNGGGTLTAEDLLPFKNHPNALGLAEMMNVPGVIHADADVIKKIEGFSDRPLDGHCPLLRGRELSAYAASGISSCHESSELEEAREKLTKGIAIWIREGSVAKDLDALIPLLNMATSSSIGFCTDDRNPLDIAREGHIDFLIRKAIKKGIPQEIAYRSSSWSVARHYGLKRLGAIAPGFRADFVLLDDSETCSIREVFRNGVPVSEMDIGSPEISKPENTVKTTVPTEADLEGATGRVHVIGVKHGKIITESLVMNHSAEGVAKLSVLERYGQNSKPANGYVFGFGKNLSGAIASSVGHDSHNLIVVGSNVRDMKVALASLVECGGGFSVVRSGEVLERLELPLGGLMSLKSPSEVSDQLKKLHAATGAIGCEIPEPFLQLAFLSLPVIPFLKLTDKGLVDVQQFKIIDVRAS